MAKRKNSKKEVIEEIVELNETNVSEEVEVIAEDIKPIDMSEDLKQMEKEIFEEPVVKEEPKVENKKENNISKRVSKLFGYIWNGVEYDF
jgi:hypothetical protein